MREAITNYIRAATRSDPAVVCHEVVAAALAATETLFKAANDLATVARALANIGRERSAA